MKVAFDSQIFSGQRYGGISRYVTRLCAGLVELGCAARIFAPIHNNGYLYVMGEEMVSGRYMPQLPPKAKKIIQPINALLSRPHIASWRPDVLHESYYGSIRSAPQGVPMVVTVHDMIHEKFPSHFSQFDNTSKLKRKSVERADRIVCISNNTKRDLQELWGIEDQKIAVVYLGCSPLVDYFPEPYQLPSGRPYLLYVANRAAYKNFSVVLKAFSLSFRVRKELALVAFGGGPFTAEEQQQICDAGLSGENVLQMHGSDDLLSSLYAGAKAFVYPSLYEGFGLSPLEAMSHGCPVISSNASCMPEVLGDGAIYFQPDCAESLAASIYSVLDDPELVRSIVEKGYAQSRKYTWRVCAENTVSVYRSLL